MIKEYLIILNLLLILMSQLTYAQKGAFSTEWQAKNFKPFASYHDTIETKSSPTVFVTMDTALVVNKVRASVFGNNMAFYQNKNTLTSQIKKQNYKNAANTLIRWPGGNISNKYFWDGVIPATYKGTEISAEDMISGTANAWQLSNDGYLQMLDSLNAEGIVCINVAYAFYGNGINPITDAAHYAANWVRYCNIVKGKKIRYWEIGNENYGNWEPGYIVDGVQITGTDYGIAFREIADSMKAADASIFVGAVLYPDESGYSNWSALVLPEVQNHADYLIIHEYFHPFKNTNEIIEDSIYAAVKKIRLDMEGVEDMVAKYTSKPSGYFPITMTEFNARTGSREITHTNALFVAMCLGEFIKYDYDAVCMWNLQNAYNATDGDMGMVSCGDPLLPDFSAYPSLYTYYYYSKYFGDKMIKSTSSNKNILAYVSSFTSGELGMVLVNTANTTQTVEVILPSFTPGNRMYWHTIAGGGVRAVYVNGVGPSGGVAGASGPQNYTSLPPYSALLSSKKTAITLAPYSLSFVLAETASSFASIHSGEVSSTKLNVYPNPYNNQLNIESDLDVLKVEVYSSSGELLKTYFNTIKNVHPLVILMENPLRKGIYFVNVTTEQGVKVVKLENK